CGKPCREDHLSMLVNCPNCQLAWEASDDQASGPVCCPGCKHPFSPSPPSPVNLPNAPYVGLATVNIRRPSVFISHARQDTEFVEQHLLKALRDHGVVAWYSKEDILSDDDWENSNRGALMKHEWFLVVMSPNSVASDWVAREVHWAMENRQGKIVAVLARPHGLAGWHPGLSQLEHIDFT